MGKTLLALTLVCTVFVASGSVPASAQSAPEYHWVLVDTLVNTEGLPLQGTFENGVGIDVNITTNSAKARYYTEQWTTTFSFSFDPPPSTMSPGETVRLNVSGEVTTNRESGFPLEVYLNLPGGKRVRLKEKYELSLDTTAEFVVRNPRRPVRDPDSLQLGVGFSLDFVAPVGSGMNEVGIKWMYRPSDLIEAEGPEPTQTGSGGEATPTASLPSDPLPTSSTPSGLLNTDCSINQAIFNRDWRKYSDLDDRIPISERSYEAQQWEHSASSIIDLGLESFQLQALMEADRRMRLEMREYRSALVRGLQANLLRAFWRLSYVTYSTIKTGTGLGESYANIFTSAGTIPMIGNALKVVKGLTPPSGANPNTMAAQAMSKMREMGIAAGLEVLTSDNPVDFGVAMIKESINQGSSLITPSADLTPEEISILQTQHLEKRVLDDVLQVSYRLNSERRKQLATLKFESERLKTELERWEQAEKDRVARNLEAGCQKQGGR